MLNAIKFLHLTIDGHITWLSMAGDT